MHRGKPGIGREGNLMHQGGGIAMLRHLGIFRLPVDGLLNIPLKGKDIVHVQQQCFPGRGFARRL